MSLTTYMTLFTVVTLVTDLSGYQDTMPFFHKLSIKHKAIGHLLKCSLCTTFWYTLVCVLFCNVPMWTLLLPFGASIISDTVSTALDLIRWLLDRIQSIS